MDRRLVPTPPAEKIVFFFDLIPPYVPCASKLEPPFPNGWGYRVWPQLRPRLLMPPEGVPFRRRLKEGSRATTLVLNLRYEPNHPLLPAANWSMTGPHIDGAQPLGERIGPKHIVIIFSPTPYPDADEAFDWARQAPPVEFDWESTVDTWAACYRPADFGLLTHLWDLAAPVVREDRLNGGGSITVVGLEDLRNVDLGLPPDLESSWPARKAVLECPYLQLSTVAWERRHGMSPPDTCTATFLTRGEYRAAVGENVWGLETTEPLGPWSEPPHHPCASGEGVAQDPGNLETPVIGVVKPPDQKDVTTVTVVEVETSSPSREAAGSSLACSASPTEGSSLQAPPLAPSPEKLTTERPSTDLSRSIEIDGEPWEVNDIVRTLNRDKGNEPLAVVITSSQMDLILQDMWMNTKANKSL